MRIENGICIWNYGGERHEVRDVIHAISDGKYILLLKNHITPNGLHRKRACLLDAYGKELGMMTEHPYLEILFIRKHPKIGMYVVCCEQLQFVKVETTYQIHPDGKVKKIILGGNHE